MQDLLSEPFQQMLEKCCTPRVVRDIEGGASASSLWQTIEESGFAHALLPESRDGANLRLRDVFQIIVTSGAYALPVPLAHTMILRPILAEAGLSLPDGSVTICCDPERLADGTMHCVAVPYGAVADWVVVDAGDHSLLMDARQAIRRGTGVHGSLEADAMWSAGQARTVRFAPRSDWRALGAAIVAGQLAGAMERILQMTVNYANERQQFGKLIGKFQAIQQQLSVMAEEVFASKMAAEMGFASPSRLPDPLLAAVAKARSSEAAWTVASIAHSVHGAMGVTAEYDLQLHTRRLHEWRLAYGSESYWNHELGRTITARSHATTVEFIRQNLFPWEDGAGPHAGVFEHQV